MDGDPFPNEDTFKSLITEYAEVHKKEEERRLAGRRRFERVIGIQEDSVDYLAIKIMKEPVPDLMICYSQNFQHFALLCYFEREQTEAGS